jgi:hypothetical protein
MHGVKRNDGSLACLPGDLRTRVVMSLAEAWRVPERCHGMRTSGPDESINLFVHGCPGRWPLPNRTKFLAAFASPWVRVP